MPATIETTPPLPNLSPVNGKALNARFDGGSLSSDGGLLALREVERRLGVAGRLAAWRDNVFVERLWRTIKYEEVYLRAYASVTCPFFQGHS